MHNHAFVRSSIRLMQRLKPAGFHGAPWIKAAPVVLRNALDLPDPVQASETMGRIGALEVRLARTRKEIQQAQKLRYKVFYRDGRAIADAATMLAQRDKDGFDKICDHLLVLDHAAPAKVTQLRKPPVVGTYRLLGQAAAAQSGGFYAENEFDIAALTQRHPHAQFLELGRSCVLPPYRTKRTVELLWAGIWNYVRQNRFDVMIGCASLEGTDPDRLALPLSFLHHFARAPAAWRTGAHLHHRIDMNRIPKDAIDPKLALRELPPLIKGYLRIGAFIGDGAVIDHQFGTTDVLIIMPVSAISARYIGHFGANGERHAA